MLRRSVWEVLRAGVVSVGECVLRAKEAKAQGARWWLERGHQQKLYKIACAKSPTHIAVRGAESATETGCAPRM